MKKKLLKKCVERVLKISDEFLKLEIIIIDDCSTDGSLSIARDLANKDPRITVTRHDKKPR